MSKFGGALTILALLISIQISFLLSRDFLYKKNPTSSYYKKYEKEAGYFSLNSEGMFHFFRFSNNYVTYPIINTKYVRFIGIRNISLYLNDREILNEGEIEYWIYDFCKNGLDNKGLNSKIFEDIPDFESHVCLKYYYNPIEKKFYNNSEKGFNYPYLIHGTANKDNLFYYITIETCRNDSHYNLIYGKNSCGTNKEISEFKSKIDGGDLYFIDNYIDVSNYKQPLNKFIQSISGTMNNLDIPIYHLLFNPLRIITHASILSNNYFYENSFSFDVKEPKTRDSDNYSIADFAFWMGNNFEIYERTYQKLQNVLASLGGIIKIFILCAEIINHPYNKYVILYDSTNFIAAHAKNERKKISTSVNNQSYFNTLLIQKDLKKKSYSLMNNYLNNLPQSITRQKFMSPSSNNIISNIAQDSSLNKINNNINASFSKRSQYPKIDKKIKSVYLSDLKKELGFKYFIKYIFQKNKRHEPLFLIFKFREKMLSEEHLYHNHLQQILILNQLEKNEKKKNSEFDLTEIYEKL
jgi:hypothetical protein